MLLLGSGTSQSTTGYAVPLTEPTGWLPSRISLAEPSPAYNGGVSESRIVADHRIMGGVPCVRGTRIPAATVIGLVAQGRTVDEILADYPTLTADDVRAVLEFAATAVSERQVPLRTTA